MGVIMSGQIGDVPLFRVRRPTNTWFYFAGVVQREERVGIVLRGGYLIWDADDLTFTFLRIPIQKKMVYYKRPRKGVYGETRDLGKGVALSNAGAIVRFAVREIVGFELSGRWERSRERDRGGMDAYIRRLTEREA